MQINSPQQIHSSTLGFEQFFESIYRNEFAGQCPTAIDFYEKHIYFVTLTLNPHKVSMHDPSGVSARRCFYQDMIDRESARIKSKSDDSKQQELASSILAKLADSDLLNKLRPRTIAPPKPHPLQVFDHLHFKLAKACLHENLQRKLRYQPFAIAFVDFEGSRRSAAVDPTNSSWPHIHALMFVRPEQQAFFEAEAHVLQNCFRRSKHQTELKTINDIARQRTLTSAEHLRRVQLQVLLDCPAERVFKGDIRAAHDFEFSRYNRDDGTLADLISYSKKGTDKVSTQIVRKGNRWREGVYSGADDLYEIFPRQLGLEAQRSSHPR